MSNRNAPEGNIFGMILRGEIPSYPVYEDGQVFAFLDIYPQAPGHTLVVPRSYSENILAATEEEIAACIKAVRLLQPALAQVTGAKGVTVVTNTGREAGQMIEYLHFHLIPRNPGDNVSLQHVGAAADPDELAQMAQKIKAALQY